MLAPLSISFDNGGYVERQPKFFDYQKGGAHLTSFLKKKNPHPPPSLLDDRIFLVTI
jgi:hypothetical protein